MKFPNWRTLTADHGSKQKPSHSHFVHNSNKIPNNDVPWSQEDYRAALDQYDAFASCDDSYILPYIEDALHTLDHAYRLWGTSTVVKMLFL